MGIQLGAGGFFGQPCSLCFPLSLSLSAPCFPYLSFFCPGHAVGWDLSIFPWGATMPWTPSLNCNTEHLPLPHAAGVPHFPLPPLGLYPQLGWFWGGCLLPFPKSSVCSVSLDHQRACGAGEWGSTRGWWCHGWAGRWPGDAATSDIIRVAPMDAGVGGGRSWLGLGCSGAGGGVGGVRKSGGGPPLSPCRGWGVCGWAAGR